MMSLSIKVRDTQTDHFRRKIIMKQHLNLLHSSVIRSITSKNQQKATMGVHIKLKKSVGTKKEKQRQSQVMLGMTLNLMDQIEKRNLSN